MFRNFRPLLAHRNKLIFNAPAATKSYSPKYSPVFQLRNQVRCYNVEKTTKESRMYAISDEVSADHFGRQQNHIWSRKEIDELMTKLYRHQPQKFSDHVMNKLVILSIYAHLILM